MAEDVARKVDRGPTAVGCPVRHDPDGVWRITGYAAGRAFLRAGDTVQAGLGVQTVAKMPPRIRRPVLYRDGPEHREDRRQTARFFTPRRVDETYRPIMERVADEQVARLRAAGELDLSDLAFRVAIDVTSAVLGLTRGKPGIQARLERFFPEKFDTPGFTSLTGVRTFVRHLTSMLAVYWGDVRPAVRDRRARRRDDLVSHLLDEGCTAGDVLGECVTFAAAGMVTTREFIVVAAWHLFTDDALRTTYLTAGEPGRLAVLHEVLRLEPVIGQVRRRTTAPVTVAGVTVPPGAEVHVHVDVANLDPDVVGDDPLSLRPARPLADGGAATGLSFGDGAHRCPGSHIAVLETDVFLRRLFAVDGLRMVGRPAVSFKEDIAGYELRGLRVAVGR
ncbi:cytochrome P450 [Saccharothrix longispora]|uniref:cytochrome P450 n=1 Tax=Saccharothrix longispora TaxID=33920 RepID=UPI0028FD1F9B|nr:cytochrome P450 [Saccharothrix longispora]MDU0291324.1 cytochrome P450 [Saccharothrix longispora]